MKKIIFLFVFIACHLMLFPQASETQNDNLKDFKIRYDLKTNLQNSGLKSGNFFSNMKRAGNQELEYTLMSNSYFTLGTYKGFSPSIIDDHCELSFGHPYSMTSFVYPVIDGQSFIPYGISENQLSEVIKNVDTLIYEIEYENILMTRIRIHPNDSSIVLSYSMTNIDDASHLVGLGVLYDVALGKWGDGFFQLEDEFLKSPMVLDMDERNSISFWERMESPKGLGVNIEFIENKPSELRLGNWVNEYSDVQDQMELYDLAMHAKWNAINLGPSERIEIKILFKPESPDYDEQIFMRWDLPSSLSIENQLLFPSLIQPNVQILNATQGEGLLLGVKGTDYVLEWEMKEMFSGSSDTEIYQAEVRFPEIYDSIVTPVSVQLLKNGQIIDKLTRPVFIPEAPFSNEGLTVSIDSAYTEDEKVNLSFRCSIEETGQFLYDLKKTNFFVYNNSSTIQDFDLSKISLGGLNKADIIFVLDVTGSMSDEIDGVKNNIVEFADSLEMRGIEYQLGMVTFLDIIENVYPFTSNVQEFQANVASQYAHGGGDSPENSLDALSAATNFDFRSDANRIIIWITDNSFHINNEVTQQTKEIVITQLLSAGIQVHCIGSTIFQTDYYDQIILNTGGKFFDINGNFRDILLEVSRLDHALNYLISFSQDEMISNNDIIKLEAHYAGLGGFDSIRFDFNKKAITGMEQTIVQAYPNPFGDDMKIRIDGIKVRSAKIEIFTLTGQLIKSFEIGGNTGLLEVELSSVVPADLLQKGTIYLLRATSFDANRTVVGNESTKIIKF